VEEAVLFERVETEQAAAESASTPQGGVT